MDPVLCFESRVTSPVRRTLAGRIMASPRIVALRGRSSFTHPLLPQPALLVSTARCASCSATAPMEPPVTLRQASACVLRGTAGPVATEVSQISARYSDMTVGSLSLGLV